MRATFRNLFAAFNIAAFLRNRHDHAMSVLLWTTILVPMAIAVGLRWSRLSGQFGG